MQSKKTSANTDYKDIFKCDIREYILSEIFTLTKHKNTKHPEISQISKDKQMKKHQNTLKYGPGTFGCKITARESMGNEADALKSMRKSKYDGKMVSTHESSISSILEVHCISPNICYF